MQINSFVAVDSKFLVRTELIDLVQNWLIRLSFFRPSLCTGRRGHPNRTTELKCLESVEFPCG